MKTRKLIFKAKLKQIKEQNQNIFLFHWNANAAQWRSFKNFFHHEAMKQNRTNSAGNSRLANSGDNSFFLEDFPFVRISTFFQSGASKKVSKAKGCILFFNLRDQNRLEEFHNSHIYRQLMTTIDSLEFSENSMLLYGELSSITANHIDIKEACSLDAETTYQQLLLSMQRLSLLFNLYLQQNIKEFVVLQERRYKQQESLPKKSDLSSSES